MQALTNMDFLPGSWTQVGLTSGRGIIVASELAGVELGSDRRQGFGPEASLLIGHTTNRRSLEREVTQDRTRQRIAPAARAATPADGATQRGVKPMRQGVSPDHGMEPRVEFRATVCRSPLAGSDFPHTVPIFLPPRIPKPEPRGQAESYDRGLPLRDERC
jgi:hypothetical protein